MEKTGRTGPAQKPYTVMVVDDTESDIDILMECLNAEYRVKVALDGKSALEDIQADPPDIILLDIIMPGMDGYEVCRRIKKNKQTRDILVFFVTSLTEPVDETLGFELGAVDYITKPFSFSVIRARIKTHLDLSEARKAVEKQNQVLTENMKLREQVEQITRHDLKNPLQAIMGIAEILSMGIDADKTAMMAQEQIKSCHTILNMINRSLDLYRMENGSYVPHLKQVDILPLVDRILMGGRDLVQSMNLRVIVTINGRPRVPGDRFALFCDEMLFYSMMSNLVQNAVEASPKGGIIELSLYKNGDEIINIENNGVVHPGIRERFFEKFVTAGKRHGTGLGTYSARLIAQLHGAAIDYFTSDRENRTMVTIKWQVAR